MDITKSLQEFLVQTNLDNLQLWMLILGLVSIANVWSRTMKYNKFISFIRVMPFIMFLWLTLFIESYDLWNFTKIN